MTDITLSANIDVGSLTFPKDANAFTVTAEPATNLIFDGTGIENGSGIVQNFVGVRDGGFGGGFYFFGSAAAGKNVLFTTAGNPVFFHDSSTGDHATFMVTPDPGISQGDVIFFDNSSAAKATFIVPTGGIVSFDYSSTAANAVFSLTGGMYGPGTVGFGTNSTASHAVINSDGGDIGFGQFATADHARITVNGATSNMTTSGVLDFFDQGTGDHATIVLHGGTASGAPGATMFLSDTATAGSAKVTINGGTSGAFGGSVLFDDDSDGGTARFILSGNGNIDISQHRASAVNAGSVEGDGLIFLGNRTLALGGNNRTTALSGVIQDGGADQKTGGRLNKVGAGTLTLNGANTYTGGTILSAGGLTIQNTSDSGTGTGAVSVSAGTLGGKGTIAGAATIGTGSGAGAFLAPAGGTKKPVTLTIQSALTLKADSTYTYTLKAKRNKSQSDQVIAKGVTIESGAQFNFVGTVQGKLRQGTSFSVISNTAATPDQRHLCQPARWSHPQCEREQPPSQLQRRRWKRSHPHGRAVTRLGLFRAE